MVKPTGGLGIPGLYVPSDPGAPDSAAAKSVARVFSASRATVLNIYAGGTFLSHLVGPIPSHALLHADKVPLMQVNCSRKV